MKFPSARLSHVSLRRLLRPAPMALLTCGWSLSGLLLGWAVHRQERADNLAFVQLTDNAQAAIQQRLESYADALRSSAGFLVASPQVGRQEWATFANALDLPEHCPGVSGIGVIYPVAPTAKEGFLQRVRAEAGPGFAIHPLPGSTPVAGRDHYVVTYLAPEAGNQAALGLDLASDGIRRECVETARDTGKPTLTRRITLVQDTEHRPGFVLHLPVYQPGAAATTVTERRAALRAWVFAPFVTEHFLKDALGKRSQKVGLDLFEQNHLDRAHLVFSSEFPGGSQRQFDRVTEMELAGQRFTLGWRRGPAFVPTANLPLIGLAVSVAAGTALLVGWVLSLQNFRERAEALVRARTAELQSSEQTYRNQFASNSAVMLLIEPANGAIRDANSAAVRFYGYSRERFLTMSIFDINNLAAAEIQAAMMSVQPEDGRRFEFQHRLADGTVREVEVSSSQIQFGGGVVLHSIITDITARKQTERALKESEEKYARVFRSAPVWIAVIDWAAATCLEVNDEALRASGFTREEIIGRAVAELGWIGPKERALLRRGILECGRIAGLEMKFRTKDGRELHGWVNGEPITLRGRSCLLTVTVDITERKRAETERAKLEAQFQQAQKLESIGRLAGGVAHDFNNLLTAISLNVEISKTLAPAGSHLQSCLEEIDMCARRSVALTRQLLAFARRQSIAPAVLNLNEAVEGMVQILRRLIGEDIELVWKPASEPGLVKIDPAQIDQILANLCVNARDAIHGTGRVTIATGHATSDGAGDPELAAGEYTQLVVSDSGCGMDKQTLAQIFEPFFTTKGAGKGTGLGLSTVYGIVKQNGGFIRVDSEPGCGATFTIYLPKPAGHAAARGTEAAPELPISFGETVLVVEDEPSVLAIARLILEKRLGYRVLTANRPSEALQIAGAHTGEIHLLITDVVMPGMNGRDLERQLSAIHPKLKTLFMSGYTADIINHHGVMDAGVNFIQKPFSMGGLATKVRLILGSAEAADATTKLTRIEIP